MPQQSSQGIDVSKEEERYLRRAFRRFALPYVFVFAVVAWVATSVVSKEVPAGSGAELSELREQVGALGQSVAGLEARIDKLGSELERAGTRVSALEKRKPSENAGAPGDTAALERTLRDASRRIAELERRYAGGAPTDERIDALVARVQRIEGIARSAQPSAPAATVPAPAPGAPAPTP
jgi:hypothetical protein